MAPMPASGAPSPQPGWYPDPEGSHAHRYWDGARWTDALSSAIPPASPTNTRDDANAWAVMAHMSAPLAMFVAMAFLGPMFVYLMKKDDPFVRSHAAAALNFQLSCLIYAVILGLVVVGATAMSGYSLLLAPFTIAGYSLPLLVLFAIAAGIGWLVVICIGAARAGQGRDYRYPLTIRFVS